jgi:hypothetical protein
VSGKADQPVPHRSRPVARSHYGVDRGDHAKDVVDRKSARREKAGLFSCTMGQHGRRLNAASPQDAEGRDLGGGDQRLRRGLVESGARAGSSPNELVDERPSEVVAASLVALIERVAEWPARAVPGGEPAAVRNEDGAEGEDRTLER